MKSPILDDMIWSFVRFDLIRPSVFDLKSWCHVTRQNLVDRKRKYNHFVDIEGVGDDYGCLKFKNLSKIILLPDNTLSQILISTIPSVVSFDKNCIFSIFICAFFCMYGQGESTISAFYLKFYSNFYIQKCIKHFTNQYHWLIQE